MDYRDAKVTVRCIVNLWSACKLCRLKGNTWKVLHHTLTQKIAGDENLDNSAQDNLEYRCWCKSHSLINVACTVADCFELMVSSQMFAKRHPIIIVLAIQEHYNVDEFLQYTGYANRYTSQAHCPKMSFFKLLNLILSKQPNPGSTQCSPPSAYLHRSRTLFVIFRFTALAGISLLHPWAVLRWGVSQKPVCSRQAWRITYRIEWIHLNPNS